MLGAFEQRKLQLAFELAVIGVEELELDRGQREAAFDLGVDGDRAQDYGAVRRSRRG